MIKNILENLEHKQS